MGLTLLYTHIFVGNNKEKSERVTRVPVGKSGEGKSSAHQLDIDHSKPNVTQLDSKMEIMKLVGDRDHKQ